MAQVQGQRVEIGDYVCFKSDIEQGGVVYRIEGDRLYIQAGPNGFDGDYLRGAETTVQRAVDCWLD
jgi:hypothetical protein